MWCSHPVSLATHSRQSSFCPAQCKPQQQHAVYQSCKQRTAWQAVLHRASCSNQKTQPCDRRACSQVLRATRDDKEADSAVQSSLPEDSPLFGRPAAFLAGCLLTGMLSWGIGGGTTGIGSIPSALADPPALVSTQTTQEGPKMTMALPQDPEDQGFDREELRTIKIFQDNTPSVVNITNLRNVRSFYSTDEKKMPAGLGSGFLYRDHTGKVVVVTNAHVIRGAAEVKVTLLDQSTYSATVVGADADKDVAVLRLDGLPEEKAAELRPVVVGRSQGLLVGQTVLAIGNPFGLDHTLTAGVISGVGRELSTGLYSIKNVIQSDAAINPGNSGGVLLDSKGRLIGINTAIADPSGRGSNSGVGFAIPVDTVKGLVEQIVTYGRVVRPAMGVVLAPPQALKQLDKEGVLVLDVPEGTPAAKAGIRPTLRDDGGNLVLGDIIVGIDGTKVKNYSDLLNVLDEKRVGDTIEVELLRTGPKGTPDAKVQLPVTLGERGAGTSE